MREHVRHQLQQLLGGLLAAWAGRQGGQEVGKRGGECTIRKCRGADLKLSRLMLYSNGGCCSLSTM